MRTRLKLNPGQKGTKRLVAQYGTQLMCVRYRYDEARRKRYKTVELIVETVDWTPGQKRRTQAPVGLKVRYHETALRERLKRAGAWWNREKRVWELPYRRVVELGLEARIVPDGSI
jgi:hypothetical protein